MEAKNKGRLIDLYAPDSMAKIVGHDGVVKNIRRILATSDKCAAYLSGGSGTGKTTISECMANAVCGGPEDIEHLPGAECGVDEVARIKSWFRLTSWRGKWKACLINEAHMMTPRAVASWLTMLDKDDGVSGLPNNRLVVFTSCKGVGEGLFGDEEVPFGRRVLSFRLRPDMDAMAEYAFGIAQGEQLCDGHSVAELRAWLEAHSGNLGALLQEIEKGRFMEGRGEGVRSLCEVAAALA